MIGSSSHGLVCIQPDQGVQAVIVDDGCTEQAVAPHSSRASILARFTAFSSHDVRNTSLMVSRSVCIGYQLDRLYEILPIILAASRGSQVASKFSDRPRIWALGTSLKLSLAGMNRLNISYQ